MDVDLDAINECLEETPHVYAVVSGSHCHGLNTENSDVDVRGVYVAPLHRILDGYPSAGTIEITRGDIDIVLQPLHKFLRLCAQGNPNILDWLFMPEEFILSADDIFRTEVLAYRDDFVTKRLYPRFKGYAMSHFQKMSRGVTRDLGAKRKKDIEKFGYSTKNAMHLIRLARTGCELLETGVYNVWREDKDELLAIRRGEWPYDKVMREGTKLIHRMDVAYESSALPTQLYLAQVAMMVINITSTMEV